MSLYVSRAVISAPALFKWAAEWVPSSKLVLPSEMHVTVCYSTAPVDLARCPLDTDEIVLAERRPYIVRLGPSGEYLALAFESAALARRWQAFRDAGASWDWGGYTPHISIGVGDTSSLTPPSSIPPFSIWLGPEKAEPLDQDCIVSAGDGGPK